MFICLLSSAARMLLILHIHNDPGIPAAFGDLLKGYPQALGQDIHAPGGAEPALAAPHTGSAAKFYAVQGAGPMIDGVEYFSLGN